MTVTNSRAALFAAQEKEGDTTTDEGTFNGTGTSSRGDGEVSLNVYKPGFIDTTTTEDMKMAIDRELGELSKALFKTSENTNGAIEEVKEWISEGPGGEIAGLKEEIRIVAEDGKATAQKVTTLTAKVDDNTSEIKRVDTASASRDQAMAESITSLTAEVANNSANITEVKQVVTTNTSAIATLKTDLSAEVNDRKAAISSESQARADEDGALSRRIDSLTATVGSNSAAISSEQVARADADTALGVRIDQTNVKVGENTASITRVEGAYAEADKAISGRVDSLTSTVGSNTAKISAVETAYVDADKVVSSKVDRVEGELNGKIGSVQTTAQTALDKVGNVESKWGVTVDANGKVAGIELNNGSKGSEFSIRADKFSFSDTSGNQSGGFSSSGGVTTFKGAINVNDKFIVDTAGNVATHGSVVADNFIGNNGYFNGTVYAKNLSGEIYSSNVVTAAAITTLMVQNVEYSYDLLKINSAEDFDRFLTLGGIGGYIRADTTSSFSPSIRVLIGSTELFSKSDYFPNATDGTVLMSAPGLLRIPKGLSGTVSIIVKNGHQSRPLYIRAGNDYTLSIFKASDVISGV